MTYLSIHFTVDNPFPSRKDYETCKRLCLEVIAVAPGCPDPYLTLALASSDRGDDEAATSYRLQAYERMTADEVRHGLGLLPPLQKHLLTLSSLLFPWTTATCRHSNPKVEPKEVAEIYFQRGDLRRAAHYFHRQLRRQPGEVETLMYLCDIAQQTKQL